MATVEQLHEMFPQAKKENLEKYHDALNAAFEEFEINTPQRQAMFRVVVQKHLTLRRGKRRLIESGPRRR